MLAERDPGASARVPGCRWPLCVLVALAGLALPAAAAAAVDPASLAPLEARAAAEGRVRVLVELAVPFAPEGALGLATRLRQRAEIDAAQAALAAHLRGRTHRLARRFRSVPWAALEVDAAALRALAASPWVRSLREDRLHRVALEESVPAVQGDVVRADGFDGAGQTVAIVDTGVDPLHPNLAGKQVGEACFASGGPGPSGDCPNGQDSDFGPGAGVHCQYSLDCRHGTHVAGIAVGEGPQYDGVAVGAGFISLMVASRSDSAATCSPDPAPCPVALDSDIIAALEAVFDTFRFAHAIAAVNVSLGGASYTSQALCDSMNAATKAAIDNLRSVEIATVASAGNNGLDDAISEPACISSAVSVGAANDNGFALPFSNAASFLSLWAPGHDVIAPRADATTYVRFSGTSQAAPHVAGAFAVLRHALPAVGVDQALAALQSAGQPVSHPEAATSLIQIRSAFEELTVACADGIDTDLDGLVDLLDPGCADATDDDERGATVCDNGLDDDGDGWADAPDDPGCADAFSDNESPQCQDGINNDPGQDALVDFDGGASWNNGVPLTAPDPQCDVAWRPREKQGCGLGAELALALLPLSLLQARRRRARREPQASEGWAPGRMARRRRGRR